VALESRRNAKAERVVSDTNIAILMDDVTRYAEANPGTGCRGYPV
jgi:hypothetical protein